MIHSLHYDHFVSDAATPYTSDMQPRDAEATLQLLGESAYQLFSIVTARMRQQSLGDMVEDLFKLAINSLSGIRL
jgi:hypothetical protein